MRSASKILVILVSIVFLSSCMARQQPIRQTSSNPIPTAAQELSLEKIGLIMSQAGTKRRWNIEPTTPGHLHGILRVRSHMAEVDIDFNHRAYTIRYSASVNLLYNGSMIHSSYNRWVAALEQDINFALHAAALTLR